jgi:hypothetical protein
MILCDTAPLFCSVDKSQPRHQAVKIFIENESSYLITTSLAMQPILSQQFQPII